MEATSTEVFVSLIEAPPSCWPSAADHYRRQQRAETAARDAGLPKGVAPATTAGREFIQAIPVPEAPAARSQNANQLQPPGSIPSSVIGNRPATATAGCGFDPRTGQMYRFDPQTGQPCNSTPTQERVV